MLPAYLEDNYISLMPGEERSVAIACPSSAGPDVQLTVRGWNVAAQRVALPAAELAR